MFNKIHFLFKLASTGDIARRYFVTNGFDGALAMLGLIIGFYGSNTTSTTIIITACFGTAIALTISGFVSAYISESAERKKELDELEQALLKNMNDSAHAQAAKLAPIFIAAANSLAPLIISLLIILPIWLSHLGVTLPIQASLISIIFAFIILFSLGVFIGRLNGQFWLWSGIRTLIIAIITAGLILGVEKLLE